MAFKIALTAGHYMGTPGKRCLKKLDPNETREWWLNNRVADKVEKLLQDYTGWELLRTDDTTGKKDVSLRKRTNAANAFKADFYLSIHHNAGVKGGNGGGIVAFVYTKASAESIEWQKALYKALIDSTWLKGNRSNPTPKKNLHEVRETNMPAVLLELGFMDSSTDVPIILSESHADRCAEAIVKVLAERGKLKKNTVPAPAPAEEDDIAVDGKWGRETTTRLQQIFGTTVDGEVSNQWKKYEDENPGLTGGWDWKDKPNGKGSSLIRAMQKWAGMPESKRDGELGPDTIKAFQKKLGTTVDGKVSKPSQMVKALQKWSTNSKVLAMYLLLLAMYLLFERGGAPWH